MGEQLKRMKEIAQQSMEDNEFTIDDVRKELQKIRMERTSSALGLDEVEPIQITNSDAEDMNNDPDFFRDWYDSELNKLVDELDDECIQELENRLEKSLIEINEIRNGKAEGKSWSELRGELRSKTQGIDLWAEAQLNLERLENDFKNKLNAISTNVKLLKGKDGMIELDPTNKSHVEWFEDDSYEGM